MVSLVSLCMPMIRPCTKNVQLCTNQLVFRFVQIDMKIDTLVIHPSPHLKALAWPLTPKMLRVRKCAPIPFFFIVFTLGVAFDFLRSLGVHQ